MEYITLKRLAIEMGLDGSTLRRYARKHGIDFLRVRTPDSGNQICLALTLENADALKNLRESQGFTSGPKPVRSNNQGIFYAVQLVPELDPHRIKLGHTTAIEARLATYHTICPNAKFLRTWFCKRIWEPAALDSISRDDCTIIANEVFSCKNIDVLLVRGDEFFALMPALEKIEEMVRDHDKDKEETTK